MENKKQDVNSLEELSKAADEFRKWAVDFGDRLAKVLADIKAPEKEEDTWEMKCPYEEDEEVWIIDEFGEVDVFKWGGFAWKNDCLRQGNTFPTKKEAETEAKRRNLLTRFRAFRDECNDGWKPDWRKNDAKYYFYISSTDGEIGINDIYFYETFPLFSYFKNEKDAEHAIELFGDEIKRLYVEGE